MPQSSLSSLHLCETLFHLNDFLLHLVIHSFILVVCPCAVLNQFLKFQISQIFYHPRHFQIISLSACIYQAFNSMIQGLVLLLGTSHSFFISLLYLIEELIKFEQLVLLREFIQQIQANFLKYLKQNKRDQLLVKVRDQSKYFQYWNLMELEPYAIPCSFQLGHQQKLLSFRPIIQYQMMLSFFLNLQTLGKYIIFHLDKSYALYIKIIEKKNDKKKMTKLHFRTNIYLSKWKKRIINLIIYTKNNFLKLYTSLIFKNIQ